MILGEVTNRNLPRRRLQARGDVVHAWLGLYCTNTSFMTELVCKWHRALYYSCTHTFLVNLQHGLATGRQPSKPTSGEEARAYEAKGRLARLALPPEDPTIDEACVRACDGHERVEDIPLATGVEVKHQSPETGGADRADDHDGSSSRDVGDTGGQPELEHSSARIEYGPHAAKGHGGTGDERRDVPRCELVEHGGWFGRIYADKRLWISRRTSEWVMQ